MGSIIEKGLEFGGRQLAEAGEKLLTKSGAKAAEKAATQEAAKAGTIHGVERTIEANSQKAFDKAADRAEAELNGNTGVKGVAKNVFNSAKETVMNHKAGTAGLVGLAGLGAYGATRFGGDSSTPSEGPIDITPVHSAVTQAASTATDNLYAKEQQGIVQFDPETLQAFIPAFHQSAELVAAAPKMMESAIEALVKDMSRDELGQPTRDGQPSPVYRDLVTALGEMNQYFAKLCETIHQQLTGDAARLQKILEARTSTEKSNTQNMKHVDTKIV